MALHLVVPGLLWPQDSFREVASDLATPALNMLLGRGERHLSAPGNLLAWLSQAFGLRGDEKPWGSLRHRGEGDGAAEGLWICADPVHIRFARDAMVATDAGELAITMDEAADITAALNVHFADVGQFAAVTPERWYLRVDPAPDIRTHDLHHVLGRNFPLFLPEGPDARRWRALLNEAQMLLHAHPCNTRREQAGRPAINSLWFWGAGALDETREACRFAAAFTGNPAAAGLARWAGIAVAPLPADAGATLDGGRSAESLAVVDALELPVLRGDAAAWRDGLLRIERDWFAPLLAALSAGTLDRLTLVAPGDGGSLQVACTPRDRWKLWRRPMAPWALRFPPGEAPSP